jgi:hypothetical protein
MANCRSPSLLIKSFQVDESIEANADAILTTASTHARWLGQ